MATASDALSADPTLEALIERFGPLELSPAEDPFRRLVVSIVNQQLSTASAEAIRARLFDRFEIAPAPLRDADEDALRDLGLSRQKIAYVKSAAETFLEDDLDRASFAGMTDEEAIGELTEIHGVGVWTAKMFLMFALARPDVFPVEDLGIRNGIVDLYGEMTRDEMVTRAERWRPHRSTACLYLWRAYEA